MWNMAIIIIKGYGYVMYVPNEEEKHENNYDGAILRL